MELFLLTGLQVFTIVMIFINAFALALVRRNQTVLMRRIDHLQVLLDSAGIKYQITNPPNSS